jgi:hypothetical protein
MVLLLYLWRFRMLAGCTVMHITTKKNPIHHKYILHQHTLQTESSTKYLGVTIQSDLKWNKHIDNISSTASKHLSRSRRFRILARKIEFGVFRLFRMRKKIFSWKNRGFWWISILFLHIIRKSVRNTPNELGKKFGIVRIDLGKKFGIVRILRMTSEKNSEFRIKVGNYHPYSENIVRFGNYSKLALRKFPH